MDEVKSLIASKTFWGAMVGIAGGLLALGHYTLSADDAKQSVELITGIVTNVGSLIAIYGRVVASKKIG